jgi:hypothetical protein
MGCEARSVVIEVDYLCSKDAPWPSMLIVAVNVPPFSDTV